MTKEAIKRVDVLLGTILCFLLTLHRRVRDRLGNRVASPVRTILFLKLIEQGATVLAARAIEQAVERVGRENVYFCVFNENRPILDILDLLPPENIIEVRHETFTEFVVDAFHALRRIRRASVDTVIDMELLARAPAIFTYLTGASRRVGLHRFTAEGPYRGDLMTHRVQYNSYIHTSRAYSLLVDALDEDPTELPLLKVSLRRPTDREAKIRRFVATDDETTRVLKLVGECAARETRGPYIILNPNTGDLLPMRMWPTDRFIELGRRILAEHPDATLLITGTSSEQAAADDVCRQIGSDRAVSIAGKTTLRDVMVLYTVADVLVTNDSGPGHFASMTDIHNIVLFGPETPQLFGPLGDNGRVIWAGLACSPCVSAYNHRFSPCTNNRCMQAITVDRVYSDVAACLRLRRERTAPTPLASLASAE